MEKKGGNLHIGPGPNTLKDEAVNHHSIRPREEENLKPGRDDPPPWIESFVGQRPLAASRASRDERSGRNFLEKRLLVLLWLIKAAAQRKGDSVLKILI